MPARFASRKTAGKALARALTAYKKSDSVVYALPRGGVVLGREVADALGLPLDLVITRKVGHPLSPEYAVCAVGEEGEPICNEAERASLDAAWLSQAVEAARAEARRRSETYLAGREAVPAEGKTAIVVDDGAATGLSLRAAVRTLRAKRPKRIVVAVPVSSKEAARKLHDEADETVILVHPSEFMDAVGAHYDEFAQVSDAEVIRILSA